MSGRRTYRSPLSDAAGAIAQDVVQSGASYGWEGTIEEREQVAALLKPFNIVYVDDMRGGWAKAKGPVRYQLLDDDGSIIDPDMTLEACLDHPEDAMKSFVEDALLVKAVTRLMSMRDDQVERVADGAFTPRWRANAAVDEIFRRDQIEQDDDPTQGQAHQQEREDGA